MILRSRVYWFNVVCAWALLAFSVTFYLVLNKSFGQRFDGYFVLVFGGVKYEKIAFSTHRLIAYLGYFYAAFFPFYFAAIYDGKLAKSGNFFVALWRSFKGLPWLEEHRQAVASFALKFMFAVFMLDVWVKDCMSLVAGIDSIYRYFTDPWYDRVVWASDPFGVFFHAFMSIVYYVDLMPFLIGYFVNLPNRHEIKSVETTFSGWFWCMLCYYPFSFGTGAILPTRYEDYLPMIGYLGPELGSYVSWAFNVVGGLLMALYASASVSLGFKASNLTSRGVVRSGMYSVIRHPAYACKNAAWWVWTLGYAYFEYLGGGSYVAPILGLAGWTFIYYKRAVTEEQHLLRSDPDYADYMKQVPYRFIPRLI